jgi:hypothetical protein
VPITQQEVGLRAEMLFQHGYPLAPPSDSPSAQIRATVIRAHAQNVVPIPHGQYGQPGPFLIATAATPLSSGTYRCRLEQMGGRRLHQCREKPESLDQRPESQWFGSPMLMYEVPGLIDNDGMDRSDVRTLFLRAMTNNDPSAMREGLELLFTHGGAVSAADEYDLRHPDYVMEMPQSGERISSRERMRAMQESFPGPPPSLAVRRVTGSGRVWTVEGVNNYGDDDVWNTVLILELADDGRMLRDTRYYAKKFDPPEWRASVVDPPTSRATGSG